jgi:hypothetical protein
VRAGHLARLVAVFEHSDALVLKDDLVLVRISNSRIGQRSFSFPPVRDVRHEAFDPNPDANPLACASVQECPPSDYPQ